MADDNLDDFDLDGIDRDVEDYEEPSRPSQRREARKLTLAIELVLTGNPAIKTAGVRRILERNRRSGGLPDTATFNREFASICRETRNRINGGQNAKKSRQSGRPKTPVASGPFKAKALGRVIASPVQPIAAPTVATVGHPLSIYGGSFGGKVFVHGRLLRDFFSAVKDQRDDAILKSLAMAVQGDPPSRACVAALHEKDRSMFEAALLLA